MTNDNHSTGKQGEYIARKFYEKENFTVLETNWQAGHLEIDLITQNDELIVFCEVKTRKKRTLTQPEAAVNKQKQRNLVRAANQYVSRFGINKCVRFDVISIILDGETHTLHHIPDAFQPQW